MKRLAAYGLKAGSLSNILRARNLTSGAGEFDAGGKNVLITPTGEFHSEHEIGDVSLGVTPQGPSCTCAMWPTSSAVTTILHTF